MKNRGKIPVKWKWAPLGQICKIIGGKPAPQTDDAFHAEGIPFVRMKDLGAYHHTTNLVNVTNRLSKEYVKKNNIELVKKGAILLPRSGSVALNHRAILGVDAVIVSHICALEVTSPDVFNVYLYYTLTRLSMQNITKKTTGLDAITFEDLSKIEIPLPPLNEQRRIAAILDKADAIRQKRQESIRLTDELLRSVFLDMFGDPVTNPKGWNIKKFAEVGALDRGISKNRPRNAPELLGGSYPLIQTGDVANSDGYIRSYKSTYSELGLKQSKMWPAGTLCITIAANIAKTGILTFDACFPDSVVGFTPNELTTTEYVQYWLGFLQKSLEDNAPESAQKNINLDILRKLNIPVPDIELQKDFTKKVKATQDIKAKLATASDQKAQLFYSLSQRAFQGEL